MALNWSNLRKIIFPVIFISALASAKGLPIDTRNVDPDEFIRLAGSQLGQLQLHPPSIQPNDNYVPVTRLTIGQILISVDNILEKKLPKRLATGDLSFDSSRGKYIFKHDHGRSTMAKDDPISVVEFEDGTLVIADGHHDYFLALAAGATTVPIEIIRSYKGSGLTKEQTWQDLIDRNLVFLPNRTAKSLLENPPGIEQVKDLPNRYLAALLAMKVQTISKRDRTELKVSSSALPPIWIKVDSSIPFVEFYIADLLEKAGIRYQKTWKEKIPAKVLEAARRVLLNAKSSGHPVISKIPVISSDAEGERLTNNSLLLKQKISGTGVAPIDSPGRPGALNGTVVINHVDGDFKGLAEALAAASLVDQNLNWTGGDTQLVIMGSYFSEKGRTRLIIDLLMQLQRQAHAAGGEVYPIISDDDRKFFRGDRSKVSEKTAAMFTDFPIDGVKYENYYQAIDRSKYGAWLKNLSRTVVINKKTYPPVRESGDHDDETLSAIRVSAKGKTTELSLEQEPVGKSLLKLAKDRFLLHRCADFFRSN